MLKHGTKNNKSSRETIFTVLRQKAYIKLFKKYTSGNFSYNKILANNIIFNDTCRIVARFKDYLIFDDNTEFLRRFYTEEESHPRLERILTFYETYSKIFPNYMILKESKYLYRNIRKKQKMIDAVNEIKREEEENRKKIKQNNGKMNKDINELFTKKVKEEIKTFQEDTTFEKYKNQFDSENEDENENSISISVLNKKKFLENLDKKLNNGVLNMTEDGEKRNSSICESFVANETNHSISGILNVLNDNKIYIKDLPKLLEFNNYSKNSQKLKNNKKNKSKKVKKSWKRNSPEKLNSKNQLFSSNNKSENPINKKYKKSENSLHSKLNKNISNSSNFVKNNINGNYLSNNTFKKVSTPSTTNGTVFLTNTEKNLNEINTFQNLIIPKGNTVLNINNNYFEQVASSTSTKDYYTNDNLKINTDKKNNKINNNIIHNSTFKKSNTNHNYKKSKNNLKNENERKSLPQKLLKSNNTIHNEEQLSKNGNKKHHIKQISQDFIYQKNLNLDGIKFNKNEKCITINEKEEKILKDKIKKFGSLSPQPTITHVDIYKTEIKKIQELNNLKREKHNYNNYFTENNDPNLITGDIKGNEDDEDDNRERENLLLHVRDLIESKKKENNNIENDTISTFKTNTIRKNNEKENNSNLNNVSKYKTISNFNLENPNTSNIIKKNENETLGERIIRSNEVMYMTKDNLISRAKLENLNEDKNKNIENKNKKHKIKNKMGFRKLPVKEKKNRTKAALKKNNNINNNYNTSSKLYKAKNKNLFRKTNNNFRASKNLFNNSIKDNSFKQTELNNKLFKKNKILNKKINKEKINNKSEVDIPQEKGVNALSHSLLYKSPNSQLSKLLMSHKKEDELSSENKNNSKLCHKPKVESLKFNKEDLYLDTLLQNTEINNSCNFNLNNNSLDKNLGNNIILTEHNNTKTKIKNNNINSNTTTKTLTRTHNMNNSDIKNKYKSSLVKKNKQKSCELNDIKTSKQQKINQELLERMNFIKNNNKNNFYQNYKENKVKVDRMKNMLGKTMSSFDNLCNSNINGSENMPNYLRNSANLESGTFQTPSTGNKKLGLYKKVINKKPKITKTDKKLAGQKGKNFATSGGIKVNRSKFLEKVKDKFNDNNNYINRNKMATMNNFNSCFNHKKI